MKIGKPGWRQAFGGPKRILVCSGLLILLFAEPTATAVGPAYPDARKLPSPPAAAGEAEVKTTANSDDEVEITVANFGDYEIRTGVTDSKVAVIAIHGGKIEPGTGELAYALSSVHHYNYYAWLGLKNKGNAALHIPSAQFAEPTALAMVAESETTLSIHGCSGTGEFTYIGGLDTALAGKVRDALTKHGFTVLDAPKHLAGLSPDNIVNKNKNGRGVQLEISKGLRIQFLDADNDLLARYAAALGEALGGP